MLLLPSVQVGAAVAKLCADAFDPNQQTPHLYGSTEVRFRLALNETTTRRASHTYDTFSHVRVVNLAYCCQAPEGPDATELW